MNEGRKAMAGSDSSLARGKRVRRGHPGREGARYGAGQQQRIHRYALIPTRFPPISCLTLYMRSISYKDFSRVPRFQQAQLAGDRTARPPPKIDRFKGPSAAFAERHRGEREDPTAAADKKWHDCISGGAKHGLARQTAF
jgi:hypothetical protein